MKLFKLLFSGGFMGVLILALALAVSIATFIENDYGAEGARLLVYNAWWFELILLLMVVNFIGMIFTKKLYTKAKLNILAIHLALLFILIGAGVTRYFSYEGQLHLRNGNASSEFVSAEKYLMARYEANGQWYNAETPVFLTKAKKGLAQLNFNAEGNPVHITLQEYSPNTKPFLIESKNGEPFITIAIGSMGSSFQINLKKGESKILYDIGFAFGDTTDHDLVQFVESAEGLMVRMPLTPLNENRSFQKVELNAVIQSYDVAFFVVDYVQSGMIVHQHVDEEDVTGVPMTTVQVNDQYLFLPLSEDRAVHVDGREILLRVDHKVRELPFSMTLNKFELERYPGSNSPSSFSSNVTVTDETEGKTFDYDIYMNHVLDYRGYRFFQSSYDKDELGTVLTVNRDYWGTKISYTGYFLLFATLIMSLLTPKTRFSRISKQLKKVHQKRKQLISVLIILASIGSVNTALAQSSDFAQHADEFAKLFMQNKDGRVEPINTMANKVLVKVSKKSSFEGMSANEVYLSMVSDRETWKAKKVIKVPETSIQELLGINQDYASFNDFVDDEGNYKIAQQVEDAARKKPSERSNHDKGLIHVDERLNVLYMTLKNSTLSIFPIPGDVNNTWVSPKRHLSNLGAAHADGNLFEDYKESLMQAIQSGNFNQADEKLQAIVEYQQEYGAEVLPSPTKQKLEILYNETNIFKKLFPFYLLIGSVLVALFFAQTFWPSVNVLTLRKILLALMVIAFVLQTAGLAVRWYISGHAPWSNGYESMIYISWATVLAGFIFMKRSAITLGVTALLAGITLLTAHMSWLNPELTNLVPVLKSYWLTIHVATITASYGFLGLGAMVAFLNLIIMIFRNAGNKKRLNLTLEELNLIIEMSLTVGLILLVIGNFLGGIWANESWGRYWGWDPKESWTLVTILMYTFTLHLTIIPKIRNTFTFSFMALISFSAVLMTYFGVNYYLTGLHSYAAGDAPPIPVALYFVLAVLFLISLLAARNEYRINKV